MTLFPVPRHRASEWPVDLLDPSMLDTNWRPVPLRHFVVKVHSRCNLACDYCYLYEMADTSWRSAAKAMSARVAERTAARIGEHARTHGLERIEVILHGGEPLLAGAERIEGLVAAVRREVPDTTEVSLSVQTNGVLLDEPMLDTLYDLRIAVGVSLDGGAGANDRHRRFADGRGSHDAVAEGLRRLRDAKRPGLYGGLLCTIDLANDPVDVYEALLSHAPPVMDFLLPHGNWTQLPPSRPADPAQTPYGDWLVAVFDRWYGAARQETRVRMFEDILSLVLGGDSGSESIGLSPATVVVVDTDGSIEQVDTLKSAFDGAAATGMSVFADSFDAVLRHPGVVARQIGVAGLSETCRGCRIRDVCGGGYFPHRYRAGEGFLNPSVYCPDLVRVIDHVRERVRADLTDPGERRLG
ncbi:FxsB family radical SAM/SPASM domain protein [Yinghuangia sp. ASG 101]|uniref:FxsB family cyclophane-forming radical SAM/SPASM peptide maturase n=1 Tax=Yinghuangia sp. ASG 101 TaxID=2896848 RepID=UPI001E2CAFAD|nr:FxsB family cyclophane-forming radical SAM/SPASM peptide maturase [Yinghuangia sp. ASG 101]UGQ09684.1 FxsB family radical SAM/SPASM domain protein [Yinghuangia sp. ASG 101]